MFASIAYAAAPSVGGEAPSLLLTLMPLILMFAVFYFLLIRPQNKRAKEHKNMLGALSKGDNVLTTGGILGRIVDVEGDILTLDIANGVKVRVARGFINGTYDPKAIQKVGEETPDLTNNQ